MMANSHKPQPPLVRERWLLEELDPEARERFERAVPATERETLRAEDQALREELFDALPASVLKAHVDSKARATATQRFASAGWLAAPALGVALVSLLMFVRPEVSSLPSHDAPKHTVREERIKGLRPRVVIFRQLEHSAEELRQGSSVKAHDLLQLGYVAGGRPYGVLLSIDGRGTVTLHAPYLPHENPQLQQQGKTQLLERSYELDDAPTFERFFFVTSRRILSVKQVLAAAEVLARDPARAMRDQLILGTDVEQSSVLLQKPSVP